MVSMLALFGNFLIQDQKNKKKAAKEFDTKKSQ